jgi:hypothetical protein
MFILGPQLDCIQNMNNFLAPDSQCSLHLAYLFQENADIGTKTTARRASLLTNTNHKAQFFFQQYNLLVH